MMIICHPSLDRTTVQLSGASIAHPAGRKAKVQAMVRRSTVHDLSKSLQVSISV